jgi:hypothetical protein
VPGTPEQNLTARDAWLAARATLDACRLEVNRLWLKYLELADPGRARKIRRILKHAEQGAAKTADELFPATVSLARSIPRPQELRHAASLNQPRSASIPLRYRRRKQAREAMAALAIAERTLTRAERFVAQMRRELAEVAKHQAIAAGIIGEMAAEWVLP